MLSDDQVLALFKNLINLHGLFGLFAVCFFWTALFAKKGALLHLRSGKLYTLAILGLLFPGMLSDLVTIFRPLITHPNAHPAFSIKLSLFTIFLSITILSNMILGYQFIKYKADLKKILNVTTVTLHLLIFFVGLTISILGLLESNFGLIFGGLLGLFLPFSFYKTVKRIFKNDISPKSYIWFHLRSIILSGTAIHIAFIFFGFTKRYFPAFSMYENNLMIWVAPLPVILSIDYFLNKRLRPLFDVPSKNS